MFRIPSRPATPSVAALPTESFVSPRSLPALCLVFVVALFVLIPLHVARAQSPASRLSSSQFHLSYSRAGLTAIRHVRDVYDTNYIARGSALGRLIVRYRALGAKQWREAGAAEITPNPTGGSSSVSYTIGVGLPTIARSSRPSASVRSFAVFALGDGLVPPNSRAFRVPHYEWFGRRGTREWVQYDFPKSERVFSSEVYWFVENSASQPCALPKSWQVLYRSGNRWLPVAATTPYPIQANQFDRVAFSPVTTSALRIEVQLAPNATAGLLQWRVNDQKAEKVLPLHRLQIRETFRLEKGAMLWTIALRNESSSAMEIGDLGLPLPMNNRYVGNKLVTYTRRVIRHAFIGGNGSFLFWMRTDAIGPFLVMTPLRGTSLEYFTLEPFRGYAVYIHSAASAAALRARGGKWQLPNTRLVLQPRGRGGDSAAYGFRFDWAQNYAAVRQVLYDRGLFDVNVVPGMTVPTDLSATFSLRTRDRIRAIVPQYPASTRLRYLGERGRNVFVYRVHFSRLGENTLTVQYGRGRYLPLQFFSTLPLESLIKKRAAFIVSHEQHRNPKKWYYGLFSQWDMKDQVLRGPDNLGGLRRYMVACDDPILGKAEFLAEKNVYYPNPGEIAAIELYIRHYVWGGLQETTREKFPYAIYGIPNWKVNRTSSNPGPAGREHVWRIYDYPHVFGMYYYMYRVAKRYPRLTHYLDAAGYLQRAFGTAKAFFTVPNELIHWSAYGTGTYDELVIPRIVRALRQNGHPREAAWLEGQWQKKVEYFVNRHPDLFQSEFPFDSTGFESTEALAKYAVDRSAVPGATPENKFQRQVTRSAAERFLHQQIRLNIGDRGWLEPDYFDLGSDFRAGGGATFTLDYMAQMGGWAILDYALHFARDPAPYFRLGYASYLSSWALVNAGTKSSDYGYWYPGKNNDGGASGGFEARPWGRIWFGNFQTPRGPWPYSGEIDLGFTGALRTSATIVARDPIFGLYAYGGKLLRSKSPIEVIPRDGLRVRFHAFLGSNRFTMVISPDGFARGRPICFNQSLTDIAFTLENRAGVAHASHIRVDGLPSGVYQVNVSSRPYQRFAADAEKGNVIAVPMNGRSLAVRIFRVRTASEKSK